MKIGETMWGVFNHEDRLYWHHEGAFLADTKEGIEDELKCWVSIMGMSKEDYVVKEIRLVEVSEYA